MELESVRLQNFRAYHRLDLTVGSGVIVLVGPNASGKTTVLEALSVLATGRSFRGARDPDLVRNGQPGYRLRGRFSGPLGSHVVEAVYTTGSDKDEARKAAFLDGHPVTKPADLLGRVPLVSFSPDDLALAKGGPSERRRFLDALLGQTSPSYREYLSRFQKVLAQRNALLAYLAGRRLSSASADGQLEPWDESLAIEAAGVQEARGEAVAEMAPLAAKVFRGLDGSVLEVAYQPDRFDPSGRAAELRRGLTLTGPHRDEVLLAIAGREARRFASQGQQRSVVLSLKLASLELVENRLGESPVLLLDDVLSELDPRRRAALLPLLGRGQAFVTTTDRAGFERALREDNLEGRVGRWFNVAAGGDVT